MDKSAISRDGKTGRGKIIKTIVGQYPMGIVRFFLIWFILIDTL